MSRISNVDACTLIQQYRDKGGWDNGQTRAIWFSNGQLAELSSLISEFGGDGVHVYLARYPETAMPGAPANSIDRITVVFVPTVNGEDLFNVESSSGGATTAKKTMKALADGTGDPGYNHGTLQP